MKKQTEIIKYTYLEIPISVRKKFDFYAKRNHKSKEDFFEQLVEMYEKQDPNAKELYQFCKN